MIFFNDPKKFYLNHKNEILRVTKDFFESGQYVRASSLKNFEIKIASYLKIKYCIGVASATDALFISLIALGIGRGDEVLVPSHTATGTGAAILQAGAIPVFLDIKEKSFNLNEDLIESKISNRTKAIIPVHLYGESCKIDKIVKLAKKNKIKVIEDCSQSFGTKYNKKFTGTYGDLGCFSFYPTKNLGSFGDGGAIITNKRNLFDKIIRIREYGWDKNRNATSFGINSRLDELQSYYLMIKLRYFDKHLKQKKAIFKRYVDNIDNPNITIYPPLKKSDHSHHLFVVLVKKRNKFISMLKSNNIYAGIHYKLPLHKQTIFKVYHKNDLPLTEHISKQIISLPMYPELKIHEQMKIISLINNYK